MLSAPVAVLAEAWFDAEVAAASGIDRFCSSSAWVLSAHETIMPPRRPYVWRSESGCFAAAAGQHASGVTYIEPLELSWGLACPIVSRRPRDFLPPLFRILDDDPSWHVLLLPGMMEESELLRLAVTTAPAAWRRRAGAPTVRWVASLDGGIDGFLGRRSREFRKAWRRAHRRAALRGVEFELHEPRAHAETNQLFARILNVEATSWKAGDGLGLTEPIFADFYRRMALRLADRGGLRVVIATLGGLDVAYCMGAVFAHEYRGLQFSYHRAHADLSLGSLCQLTQIERLCAQSVASYDLGTDMDYKRRWAERAATSELLVLSRS